MRTFKISEEMLPWLKNVLARDDTSYIIKEGKDGDGRYYVSVDLSGMKFREKVEDAMCERQMTRKVGLGPKQVFLGQRSAGIPVYSARTLKNPAKKGRLMRYYGHSSYQILEKDKEKVMEDFLS